MTRANRVAVWATAVLAVAALVAAPAALAASHRVVDPIRNAHGQPVPCPDPDALSLSSRPYTVEISCTSDRNEGDAPGSAFALYRTHDLRRVTRDGSIFPPGREPWWAVPSPAGIYWAPTIVHLGRNYVAYFAAVLNPERKYLVANGSVVSDMVLGVAWGRSLHTMWRHTRVLHYVGQFNHVAGSAREPYGGAIDPTVERDPRTGTIYIAYCEQPNRIMLGTLTPNGLAMRPGVKLISWANLRWEGYNASHNGVEEGPVLIWNPALRAMTAIVNTDSTWAGSYKQAFLVSFDPASGHFYRYDRPIFVGGGGLYGPGMGSRPFLGPDGRTQWIYMHVQLHPNPFEMRRYLALESYHSSGTGSMLVPLRPGDATPAAAGLLQQTARGVFIRVPVPAIGTGHTQRAILTPFLDLGPASAGAPAGWRLRPSRSRSRSSSWLVPSASPRSEVSFGAGAPSATAP